MNTLVRFVGSSVVALASVIPMVDVAQAQPGRGGFGPRGEGGFRPGGGSGGAGLLKRLPVMKALDADQDGKISASEIENAAAALKGLDKNNDGELTEDELRPSFGGRGMGPGGIGGRAGFGGRQAPLGGGRGGPGGGQAKVWEFLANKYDKNKDGKLTENEYDRGAETFARLDRNEDGVLTPEDWVGVKGPFGSGEGQRPGDGLKGVAPKQGEPAPDFELSYVAEPEKTVSLSSFAGKKPVALIFGSCT